MSSCVRNHLVHIHTWSGVLECKVDEISSGVKIMASVGFVSSGTERARAGGGARTCKCSVWVSLIGDRVCYVRSTVSTDCRSTIDGGRLPEADCARTVHTAASRVGILNNMSAVWLSGSRRKQGAQEKLYPSALYTHRR